MCQRATSPQFTSTFAGVNPSITPIERRDADRRPSLLVRATRTQLTPPRRSRDFLPKRKFRVCSFQSAAIAASLFRENGAAVIAQAYAPPNPITRVPGSHLWGRTSPRKAAGASLLFSGYILYIGLPFKQRTSPFDLDKDSGSAFPIVALSPSRWKTR